MLTEPEQLSRLPDSLPTEPAPVLVASGKDIDALIAGDPETYARCRSR